jgi:hypothetical protein
MAKFWICSSGVKWGASSGHLRRNAQSRLYRIGAWTVKGGKQFDALAIKISGKKKYSNKSSSLRLRGSLELSKSLSPSAGRVLHPAPSASAVRSDKVGSSCIRITMRLKDCTTCVSRVHWLYGRSEAT